MVRKVEFGVSSYCVDLVDVFVGFVRKVQHHGQLQLVSSSHKSGDNFRQNNRQRRAVLSSPGGFCSKGLKK